MVMDCKACQLLEVFSYHCFFCMFFVDVICTHEHVAVRAYGHPYAYVFDELSTLLLVGCVRHWVGIACLYHVSVHMSVNMWACFVGMDTVVGMPHLLVFMLGRTYLNAYLYLDEKVYKHVYTNMCLYIYFALLSS
eukprot:GHVS01066382.1.p1 GENE.GHVS01066382.1~~GHVS01066382.1.p1  ORF type:complete len:135 (-),score=9.44 GHVS01066382.1:520-924(-)